MNDRKGHRATDIVVAALLLVLPLGMYLAAAAAAAHIDATTIAQVVCFDAVRIETDSITRNGLSVVMAVAAVSFLFVVPGLLATLLFFRVKSLSATAYVWSLAINSAALILLFLLLRTTIGVERLWFVAGWWGWTLFLFSRAWQANQTPATLRSICQRRGWTLLVAVLAATISIVVLFPEQFVQCFNEDGTENYELARSLRHHLLPAWEPETWEPLAPTRIATVVVNPSLMYSNWTAGTQVLLGDSELATRLPYWIWWLAIVLVCHRIIEPQPKSRGLSTAIPLALLMFLVSMLYSFYTGYNPYMTDLANLGVQDSQFALLILMLYDCLRHHDSKGFAVSAVMASLALYAGPVIVVLTLASAWLWRPMPRLTVIWWGVKTGAVLLSVVLFYLYRGWLEGVLPLWIETLDMEYLNDYMAAVPRWQSGVLFFGYFLVCCGGYAALGLVIAFRRGAWERTAATATLLYLLIVLRSGFKSLHYLGPLLPIPIVLLFVSVAQRRMRVGWMTSAVTSLSLIACIAVCWPAQRETFTLNRQLGHRTTIATDSYVDAIVWARIRIALRPRGIMSWDCDPHTWVAYSELDASLTNPRDFVLTTGAAPSPNYLLLWQQPVVDGGNIVKLYARNREAAGWLASQTGMRPTKRYAPIFQLLADGVYSPHNNNLPDVKRLQPSDR